jgi:hypothetical protein
LSSLQQTQIFTTDVFPARESYLSAGGFAFSSSTGAGTSPTFGGSAPSGGMSQPGGFSFGSSAGTDTPAFGGSAPSGGMSQPGGFSFGSSAGANPPAFGGSAAAGGMSQPGAFSFGSGATDSTGFAGGGMSQGSNPFGNNQQSFGNTSGFSFGQSSGDMTSFAFLLKLCGLSGVETSEAPPKKQHSISLDTQQLVAMRKSRVLSPPRGLALRSKTSCMGSLPFEILQIPAAVQYYPCYR